MLAKTEDELAKLRACGMELAQSEDQAKKDLEKFLAELVAE
jgi:hypothetical protein